MPNITDTFTVDNGGERARSEIFELEPTLRPNPCETCALAIKCADNGTDCFAFRRWTNCGDYSDKQLRHLIRRFE